MKIITKILTVVGALAILAAVAVGIFFFKASKMEKDFVNSQKNQAAPQTIKDISDKKNYSIKGVIRFAPILESTAPQNGMLTIQVRNTNQPTTPAKIFWIKSPKFPYSLDINLKDLVDLKLGTSQTEDRLVIHADYTMSNQYTEADFRKFKPTNDVFYRATAAVPADGKMPVIFLTPKNMYFNIFMPIDIAACSEMLKNGITGQLKTSKILPIKSSAAYIIAYQVLADLIKPTSMSFFTPSEAVINVLGYTKLTNAQITDNQPIKFQINVSSMFNNSVMLGLAHCPELDSKNNRVSNEAAAACMKKNYVSIENDQVIAGENRYPISLVPATNNILSCKNYTNLKYFAFQYNGKVDDKIKVYTEEFKSF